MTYGYIKMIRGFVGHTPIILNCAGGVLLNAEHEVLLNLRADTHNWSLPGGYLEYGETYAEGLVREYKEDSGLDVRIIRPLKLFDRGEIHYPNGDIAQTISMLYLVAPVAGQLLSAETDETLALKFWPFAQLPPLLNRQTEEMLAYAATIPEVQKS